MKKLMTFLSNKDVLSLQDISSKEILSIIKLANTFKKELKNRKSLTITERQSVWMVFQKPSTRTRVSFETGISQLGGNTCIPWCQRYPLIPWRVNRRYSQNIITISQLHHRRGFMIMLIFKS